MAWTGDESERAMAAIAREIDRSALSASAKDEVAYVLLMHLAGERAAQMSGDVLRPGESPEALRRFEPHLHETPDGFAARLRTAVPELRHVMGDRGESHLWDHVASPFAGEEKLCVAVVEKAVQKGLQTLNLHER